MPVPSSSDGFPDFKRENAPELASHYLDVPNMPWEDTGFAGIKIKILYSDLNGITTALFKLDPGAVVPLHEHTALEQTFVIEGTLEDHEGACGPGQFVWRPAGNTHDLLPAPLFSVSFSSPIASRVGINFSLSGGAHVCEVHICLSQCFTSSCGRSHAQSQSIRLSCIQDT